MLSRIRSFLAPPVFIGDDDKTHNAYLLNIILLALVPLLTILLILEMVAGYSLLNSPALQTIATLLIMAIGLFFFMKRGYVGPASFILVAFGFVGLTRQAWSSTGIYDTAYIALLDIILIASLLLGWKAGACFTAIAILVGWWFVYAEVNGIREFAEVSPPGSVALELSVIFAMAAVVNALMITNLRRALRQARESNQALQVTQAGLESRVIERTRDLELAADIGRSLAQVRDVETLLAHAVESVRSRFELYYAQIYLVDAAGQNLILRAGTGTVGQELKARNHQLPLNAGSINGAAVTNHRAVIVADTETSPMFRRNPLLPETRSEMAVPLVTGDKVVGVLDLQSTQPHALSSENLAAFEILAGQLAIAIENARLIRDTDRARAELEARIQVNIRQEWDRYLDAIHHAERVGYIYAQGELQAIQPATESDNDEALRLPIQIAGETIGVVELAGQTTAAWSAEDVELVDAVARQVSQQIENLRLLEESERYRQEAEQATHRLIREGWAGIQEAHQGVGFYYDHTAVQPLATPTADPDAILRAPLAVQGETIGQLELSGIAGDDEQSTRFLTAVAERLSAQLENLRLSEQTERALAQSRAQQEELAILNELSRKLTTVSDLDSAFALIYEYAARLVDTSSFYIVLYEEAKEEIFFAFEAFDGKVERPFFRRKMGNGVTEYVIRSKQPLLLADNVAAKAEALGIEFIGKEARAWLGVPMLLGDNVLGVIAAQNYHTPRVYNEDSERRLTALANQATVAIENVRLFTQIQNRARQEQILREVTARVHSAVDAQSVLRTAAQEINRTLGLEAFVYLEEQIESETHRTNGGNGRHETALAPIGEPQ
jgi:GAF domain-containing protein